MPELEMRLRKACEYRMVSDVPVGVFLSGGYDSTLVTALLQSGRTERLKTFTIGFEDHRYNEANHAKEIAGILDTDHNELICTDDDVKEILPKLADYFDEPFGDSSAIPTTLVSRFARSQVTVALSADGGDELFAGYKRYDAILRLYRKIEKQPKAIRQSIGLSLQGLPNFLVGRIVQGNTSKENILKYVNFFKGKSDIVDMIDYANQSAMPDFISPFLGGAAAKLEEVDFFRKETIRGINDPLEKLLAFDYVSYLPGDILTKVDRATMSASLEGREPLLDHSLFEYVAQLPSNLKYDTLTSKLIMRKIAHKFVPERIMNRPKMGFAIPLVDWFRNDLKYLFEERLTKEKIAAHGLINYERLREEMNKYYKGYDLQFTLLWNIYVFQSWYDKWLSPAA
jgi:asparagine synthase (glutamine-hydrolysing)